MTTMTRASASDILPDLVSAKLEAIAETESDLQWRLGDAVIELAAELFPRHRKAEIVAAVATRAQLQPSAVRAREATARFWDEADRAEFDGLSYSHFRLAMRQPLPRSDLQFCLDSADDYGGQPMPYHAYCQMVKERAGGRDEPTVAELLERATAVLSKAYELDPADTLRGLGEFIGLMATEEAASKVITELRFAASELREAAGHWGKE